MINETWAFGIILLLFTEDIIKMFMYANGYKKEITWNNDLNGRIAGVIVNIMFIVIHAIALGWILR